MNDAWQLIAALAPPEFTPLAIQKAKQRGRVPHKWRLPIARAAQARGIDLPPDFFEPHREDAA